MTWKPTKKDCVTKIKEGFIPNFNKWYVYILPYTLHQHKLLSFNYMYIYTPLTNVPLILYIRVLIIFNYPFDPFICPITQ